MPLSKKVTEERHQPRILCVKWTFLCKKIAMIEDITVAGFVAGLFFFFFFPQLGFCCLTQKRKILTFLVYVKIFFRSDQWTRFWSQDTFSAHFVSSVVKVQLTSEQRHFWSFSSHSRFLGNFPPIFSLYYTFLMNLHSPLFS